MRIRLSVSILLGLALAICLVAPSPASAQGWGLKFGLNNATLFDKNNKDGYTSYRGLVAGLYGPPKRNANSSVQTEVLYSVKGARFSGNSHSFVKLTYVEVPILVRIKIAGSSAFHVHALVGPSLAFKFKVDSDDGSGNSFMGKDDVKVYDVGLAAGGDVEIGHLVIDGRYTWGLVNIVKNPDPGQRITNRALTILVGVRFRKG